MKKCGLFLTLLSLITAQSAYPLTIVNCFGQNTRELLIRIHCHHTNPGAINRPQLLSKQAVREIIDVRLNPGEKKTIEFAKISPQHIEIRPRNYNIRAISWENLKEDLQEKYSLKEFNKPDMVLMIGGENFNPARKLSAYLRPTYKFLNLDTMTKEQAEEIRAAAKVPVPDAVVVTKTDKNNILIPSDIVIRSLVADYMIDDRELYGLNGIIETDRCGTIPKCLGKYIREAATEPVAEEAVGMLDQKDDILIPAQTGIRSLIAEYLIDTEDPSAITTIIEGELKKAQEKAHKA